MVFYSLDIYAHLGGLSCLQPRGGCDDPDFSYYIKMRCDNCGEISPKWSCVILSEKVRLPDGKGDVHLYQKCKMCGKEGTVKMIPGNGKPCMSGIFQCLMVFECNGSLTPVEFSFGNEWKAQTSSGDVYEIDLSKGDFAEYDEKEGKHVTFSNLKHHIRVVRK
ncbi:hypothetical protein LUZ60_008606 [Juncus effusus]|nr:hypothetical protein LUZ60_008606 [Juncus effusus]